MYLLWLHTPTVQDEPGPAVWSAFRANMSQNREDDEEDEVKSSLEIRGVLLFSAMATGVPHRPATADRPPQTRTVGSGSVFSFSVL